jgi:Sap, sulfolipid-1-addressing protein
MGAAIGEVLGLAAGVAVSPLPIVAMILLLATPRGRVNGIRFGAGWLAGLAVLGAVVLLIAGPSTASSGGEPAAWVGWLKLVLGWSRCCSRFGSGAASQRKAPSQLVGDGIAVLF